MTTKSNKPRGLGRGLSSLMADVKPAAAGEETAPRRADLIVPIEKIVPNPDQPRRNFDDAHLADLTNSIREKGVIQPLIVRRMPDETYQIVAGERRWRASQMAKLHELPVLVRDYSDTEVLEVAIIENIQRADLNSVEEAAGYRQLMDRFGHTQEKLAEALGKSRSHIANLLRLLQLPDAVQGMLVDGRLTAGHARALITAEDPVKLANLVVKGGLSVRETERLAKDVDGRTPAKAKTPSQKAGFGEKDADTRALEQDLSSILGMEVRIDHNMGSESGQISIKYSDLDALDDLCRMLSAGISAPESIF